jgi:hypothetical protein
MLLGKLVVKNLSNAEECSQNKILGAVGVAFAGRIFAEKNPFVNFAP